MAEKSVNGTLMWILTFMILIGFVLIYKNLNGEIVFSNRYEGLIIALIGLICSVFVGVKSSKKGIESFTSLYSI